MEIDELLLSDYGTIPQKIGMFLLRKNASTLDSIRVHTSLKLDVVRDGLSFLIQRRIVNFFAFERNINYCIDREMLRKRLYFPLYVRYVSENFSTEHLQMFTSILVSGIIKISGEDKTVEDLVDAGILMPNPPPSHKHAFFHKHSDDTTAEHADKKRKTTNNYIVVDYARLGLKISETAIERLIKKKYNDAAVEVYRALLKCTQINKASIIKNLSSTKILLIENGAILNDKNNINDYLNYLCASGILIKGADAERAYSISTDLKYLKRYVIAVMIKDPACRRLFNLLSGSGEVDDKTLTMNALLRVNTMRESILKMQREGLLQQRCVEDYKGSHRIEHSWAVDLNFACKQLIIKIESTICRKLRQFNGCWDVNYFMGSGDLNDSVWASDLMSLGFDHLVLCLE